MANFRFAQNIITSLCLLSLTIMPISSGAMISNEASGSLGSVNYESVNKPLSDFFNEINKQTSYKIKIADEWFGAPVTLLLKDVTVENGIEIALKQLKLSHSLVITPNEKKIDIYVANNSISNIVSNKSNIHSKSSSQVDSVQTENEQLYEHDSIANETNNILDLPAVPPEDGVESTTIRELSNQNQKSGESILDLSVVPPEDGVENPTLQDLSLHNQESNEKDLNMSAVPPEEGVETITEKELLLKKQESDSKDIGTNTITVVPPEDGVKSSAEQ